jgi:hypothetical protein
MSGSKGVVYDKYPSTPYLTWSPEKHRDDSYHPDESHFEGREVVITEKMDGENCVDGDTVIETEDGEMMIREICENQYEKKVKAYDPIKEEAVWRTVDGWFIENSSDDEWYELEAETGETVKLTGDHRVYLPELECYRKVKDLKGDEVVMLDV